MKESINLRRKKRFSKIRIKAYGLIFLTICLTLLSLRAQFRFWHGLFGLEIAVTAAAVFETMRLASLFAVFHWKQIKRIIGTAIYIGLASFTGVVGVVSWYSQIIELDSVYEMEKSRADQKNIIIVKNAYTKSMTDKIAKVENDIRWIDNNLAKNPNSAYWRRRREQYVADRTDLQTDLEAFLSESPDDAEVWLQKNIARLGLQIEPIDKEVTRLSAIEQAIQNTLNMNAEQAKRAVAIVFVVVIELGIILLSVIAGFEGDIENTPPPKDNLTESLIRTFGREDVDLFVKKCRQNYLDSGDLPKSSEIALRLRPIRKAILDNGFEKSDLDKIFIKKLR